METCHLGRPHGCPWPWTWRPCAQCQASITLMSRVLANSDLSEPMTRGAMCMRSTSWARRCLEPLDRGHNSLSGRGVQPAVTLSRLHKHTSSRCFLYTLPRWSAPYCSDPRLSGVQPVAQLTNKTTDTHGYVAVDHSKATVYVVFRGTKPHPHHLRQRRG